MAALALERMERTAVAASIEAATADMHMAIDTVGTDPPWKVLAILRGAAFIGLAAAWPYDYGYDSYYQVRRIWTPYGWRWRGVRFTSVTIPIAIIICGEQLSCQKLQHRSHGGFAAEPGETGGRLGVLHRLARHQPSLGES